MKKNLYEKKEVLSETLSYSEEYKECMNNWRFIIGTRFTILGFYLSFVAIVLFQVLNPEMQNNFSKLIFSAVAFVFSIFILILQIRNRELYYQCAERAKEIEEGLVGEKRLMGLMDTLGKINKAEKVGRHTIGLYGLHLFGIILWEVLLIFYIYSEYPKILFISSSIATNRYSLIVAWILIFILFVWVILVCRGKKK